MILVTGSLAFDFIMNFPGKFSDHILAEKIHTINLSFLVADLRQERGGCAGNIAYNLALLGEKPLVLGYLGKDGIDYKSWLKKQGVDVAGIHLSQRLTSRAHIMTDQTDNQITSFYPGPQNQNYKLQITNYKFAIIAPNDPKAMMNFVKQCQRLEIPYLFDPGMQLPRLSKKDLEQGIKGAKIVIGNDYEMALIKSKSLIISHQSSIIWVTTLGEKGSIIKYQNKKIKIKPAKPKKVVDPTGAGDAYRAGFVFGYLKGYNLKQCGQLGSVCAVYTVEKYGTTTHHFTKKEFTKRYFENYKEKIDLEKMIND